MQNRQHKLENLITGLVLIPGKGHLAETLTTDIELTDALFDLIDNSIDAGKREVRNCEPAGPTTMNPEKKSVKEVEKQAA